MQQLALARSIEWQSFFLIQLKFSCELCFILTLGQTALSDANVSLGLPKRSHAFPSIRLMIWIHIKRRKCRAFYDNDQHQ